MPPSGGGTVLVVGSINVDLVVTAARLPGPGETVGGGSFARHHGGKGANQAVAAARLGAPVVFMGAMGDDDLGAAALAELRAETIDTSRVRVLSGQRTGVALIVVDERGENQIAVAPGANGALDGSLVEAALSELSLSGGVFLANFEIGDEALMAGARFAANTGMAVVINPAPARDLPPELLGLSPFVIPNRAEARTLTGLDDPLEAARALAAVTSASVVVTLGVEGALLVEGDRAERFAAPRVEVVDTTGAGDAFAGALAAQLAAGAAVSAAVPFAVAAAAHSVTRAGAREGMPSRLSLMTS